MAKKTKVFEELFFNELFQATEKTLEKFSEEYGWEIEDYEKGKTRKWTVQAVPELSLFKFHFLPKAAYKKMKIIISNHNVVVECVDNWPRFTFDFLNQKKKTINLFFNQLNKTVQEDF